MKLPFASRSRVDTLQSCLDEAHRANDMTEDMLRSFRRAFFAEHERRLQMEREVRFRDGIIRRVLGLSCFDGVREERR